MDNDIYTWGWGKYGQLGHGDELNLSSPHALDRVLLQGNGIQSMACGLCYNLAITTKNDVYSWGYGKNCQLGQTDDRHQHVPRRIQALQKKKVIQVAAGYEHSVACTKTGEVYTWGCGAFGMLGRGDEKDQIVPMPLEMFGEESQEGIKIVSVACGLKHTLALDSSGLVYSWGYGGNGRLGHGDNENQIKPRIIERLTTANPQFKAKAKKIGCGWNFSLIVDNKGYIWTWGYGKDNELGRDSVNDSATPEQINTWTVTKKVKHMASDCAFVQISDVACGSKHVLALSIDGDVYSWGRGEFGRLGHGDTDSKSHPYVIEALVGHKITKIAAGGYHSGAMNDNEVYTWGCGEYGRLGHGDTADRYIPTKVEELGNVKVTALFMGAYITAVCAESKMDNQKKKKCIIM